MEMPPRAGEGKEGAPLASDGAAADAWLLKRRLYRDSPPLRLPSAPSSDGQSGWCDVAEGEVLADRYQILHQAGKGVFATVWAANDLQVSTAGHASGIEWPRNL